MSVVEVRQSWTAFNERFRRLGRVDGPTARMCPGHRLGDTRPQTRIYRTKQTIWHGSRCLAMGDRGALILLDIAVRGIVAKNEFFINRLECKKGPSSFVASACLSFAGIVGGIVEHKERAFRSNASGNKMHTATNLNLKLYPHKMNDLPLPLEDYKRYGRQMILDGFGLNGLEAPWFLEIQFSNPTIRSDQLVQSFSRGRRRRWAWLPCIAVPWCCRHRYA